MSSATPGGLFDKCGKLDDPAGQISHGADVARLDVARGHIDQNQQRHLLAFAAQALRDFDCDRAALTASSEWPPISKKLSSTLTECSFSTASQAAQPLLFHEISLVHI